MVRLDTGKNRNTAKIAKEQANKLQTNYSQTYSHIQRKIRSDFTQDLAEECIVCRCPKMHLCHYNCQNTSD